MDTLYVILAITGLFLIALAVTASGRLKKPDNVESAEELATAPVQEAIKESLWTPSSLIQDEAVEEFPVLVPMAPEKDVSPPKGKPAWWHEKIKAWSYEAVFGKQKTKTSRNGYCKNGK